MVPRKSSFILGAAIVFAALLLPSLAFAADVITVGTVSATGGTVDVPIYIRDASGTPLGMDQPAGSKIQSFSIKVTYSPASAIDSISIARAGITANLTPTFESKPSTTTSISILDTFSESTNPIPFNLNAASPGNLVAHLTVALSSSATPGSSITLTLDPAVTQLTDQGGSAATKETVGNGQLTLTNGAINLPALSISLIPATRNVPLGGTAQLGVTLNVTATSNTTVNLSSSNTTVAKVPPSVVIPANSNSATFNVSGTALGTAQITATLAGGGSTSTANVTVIEAPVVCNVPPVPTLTAPATADAGASYTVSWNAVSDATEYLLDESTDANFAGATTQTLTTTSATFTHATGNVRYYYRVRAHNAGGTCNLFSDFSSAASVLINPVPVAASRVLAVVGTVQGGAGSNFKTSVQLYNPKDVTISGKIIFHTQNASGSASDPSLAYSIAPGKTLVYADLLPAMGIASGVGSADIVASLTSPLPVSLVRVYNDAGALGTTGLAEEQLSEEEALQAGTTGALIAPADLAKFRLNIGVRTLAAGVTTAITVRDKDGAVVKTLTKSFGPTFFTQQASSQMLDYTLAGGETISFNVTSGSAFIYGATTDNTTNDPSVQFARRIE